MKRMARISRETWIGGIVMAFLLLASMNAINRYYYFVFIAFAIFLLIPRKKLVLDMSILFLLALAVAWDIFAPAARDSIYGPLKPFTYVLCYMLGASFLEKREWKDGKEYKQFYWFITIIAAGPFIHYVLNWIKNGNSIDRNTIDIWTDSVMAATGQAAMACIPLALAVACIFSGAPKLLKVMSVAVIAVILSYNFILAGRTLIIFVVMELLIGLAFYLKATKGKRLQTVLIFLAVVALVVVAYQVNLFGMRQAIEASPLYDRFFGDYAMELHEDGRAEKRLYFLSNMHRYPIGGAYLRYEMGYAHDILLDTYDEAGIFALVALMAYLASALLRLIKCLMNKSMPFDFKQIVLCVYVISFVEFMIEPTLQGMPWLFASFCLIDGFVSRILRIDRAKKRRAALDAHL